VPLAWWRASPHLLFTERWAGWCLGGKFALPHCWIFVARLRHAVGIAVAVDGRFLESFYLWLCPCGSSACELRWPLGVGDGVSLHGPLTVAAFRDLLTGCCTGVCGRSPLTVGLNLCALVYALSAAYALLYAMRCGRWPVRGLADRGCSRRMVTAHSVPSLCAWPPSSQRNGWRQNTVWRNTATSGIYLDLWQGEELALCSGNAAAVMFCDRGEGWDIAWLRLRFGFIMDAMAWRQT